ncbi:hypothetical protein KDM41_14815 [bacterium]|nr:hypothetical protein [bacterium]
MIRFVSILLLGLPLLAATTAAGQPAETAVPAAALTDTTGWAAAADSLLADDTPRPNPAAVAVAPVDLWDTGISPTAAVVMTPLFPGWGQLYSRNSWKAALGFGTQMYFWTHMLSRDRQAVRARDYSEGLPVDDPNRDRYRDIADESWEQMRDFAWWSGGTLLIIALDAYVGAHLFDFDQDPVPVPDRWDDTFGPVADAVPGQGDGPVVTVFQWRKTF